MCFFRGLRLSFGHFGQQAPESLAPQLQDGVSTSPLPLFIVDLLAFKNYPGSSSFFQWKFMRVLKGKPRERLIMGRNSSGYWCSFEVVVHVTINTYLLRHSLLAAILNRNGCHIEVFWPLFIIGVWHNFRGTFDFGRESLHSLRVMWGSLFGQIHLSVMIWSALLLS